MTTITNTPGFLPIEHRDGFDLIEFRSLTQPHVFAQVTRDDEEGALWQLDLPDVTPHTATKEEHEEVARVVIQAGLCLLTLNGASLRYIDGVTR